ncbi:MAG: GNAT family N-acetyltransferase [Candidatus Competibacteraceae bacterium]|nr:GNAT family N-acetyltransferase [Candidatus Competibacteraceae bacterium]
MRIVAGVSTEILDDLQLKVARYRYAVFVERLGWKLQTRNGEERDQFDRSDTVYVVAQNENGAILGCARLLPTTRPYLLGDVFSRLLRGMSPPCSPEIWELSRFAALDFDGPPAPAAGSSAVAVGLLEATVRHAAARGAKRLITISPLGVERLLKRAGFRCHRAGPPTVIDGQLFFACWIEAALEGRR